MGNRKHATCHATMLQNELISDVARFTIHNKPVLQQIRLLTGLNWVIKPQHRFSTCSAVMLQNKLHVFDARFTEA